MTFKYDEKVKQEDIEHISLGFFHSCLLDVSSKDKNCAKLLADFLEERIKKLKVQQEVSDGHGDFMACWWSQRQQEFVKKYLDYLEPFLK